MGILQSLFRSNRKDIREERIVEVRNIRSASMDEVRASILRMQSELEQIREAAAQIIETTNTLTKPK
jgi:signal transduction histidine kinase